MPSLAHHSNEFWANFLGVDFHFDTNDWPRADVHISDALSNILIWLEADRPADKAFFLRIADDRLKYAASDIEEESCYVRKAPLILLHERLPLIIDDVLRNYRERAHDRKIELPTELRTTLGKTLLKARDELASPPWKDLFINVETSSGKVVMRLDIEYNSLLENTEKKAEKKMETIKKKTLSDEIYEQWSNFVWDIWYPFTDRFLGVAKAFELREYEFEAVQKYLEIYVSLLIHYLADVPDSENERFLTGLRRCIELMNKHLARIRYKPEFIQEELFDDNGIMINRGIQRCMKLFHPELGEFQEWDLGKNSAIVRRILYYGDHITRMEWSNLYLKVAIKNGVVVMALDEEDLEFVFWHEQEFNECFYNIPRKT